MDSFACGFETRNRVAGQPVSHFLTPPAQKASRCSFVKLGPSRVALSTLNTITQPFPMFCLCLFLFCYCFFIHQNVYTTFTLPPKPRCLPLHRICYLVLTDYQNVQFACKFAVMPRCLPTQPVTPRSMVMGLLPGFTCQPNSIMPLLPFTLGLGASPLTL